MNTKTSPCVPDNSKLDISPKIYSNICNKAEIREGVIVKIDYSHKKRLIFFIYLQGKILIFPLQMVNLDVIIRVAVRPNMALFVILYRMYGQVFLKFGLKAY